MTKLKVLILCEESQRICMEFRKLNHNAFSCDLQDCSGGHPEFHIKGNVFQVIHHDGRDVTFSTMDGTMHRILRFDLVICHPCCRFLSNAGARYLNRDKYGKSAIERIFNRQKAILDFLDFVSLCEHISDHYAIENPIGCMSEVYRAPDQIIQPWQFGDNVQKSTCLWLKNLPPLQIECETRPEPDYVYHTNRNGKTSRFERFFYETRFLPEADRRRERSKTFPGIARAIASQWGDYLLQNLRP